MGSFVGIYHRKFMAIKVRGSTELNVTRFDKLFFTNSNNKLIAVSISTYHISQCKVSFVWILLNYHSFQDNNQNHNDLEGVFLRTTTSGSRLTVLSKWATG